MSSAQFCCVWVWNLPWCHHLCWNRSLLRPKWGFSWSIFYHHQLNHQTVTFLFTVSLLLPPSRLCGSELTVVYIIILRQKASCWLTNHEIKEHQHIVISSVNGVCVCPVVGLWPIRGCVPVSPCDAEIGFSTPDALIRNKWWLWSISGQTIIRRSDVR